MRGSAGAGPVFRFAPSPNGRLHLGHAYSALLNADLARRMGGRLLLRIEDIDPGRSRPDLIAAIVDDLAWLGLRFDEPPWHQSQRLPAYRAALVGLSGRGLAYPCFCSRRDVASAGRPARCDPDGAPLYPGTCRALPASEVAARLADGLAQGWRLDMAAALRAEPGPHRVRYFEPAGVERETIAEPARWGDAMIGRRDVPTSYHLAVVTDDHAQRVTHVVRGADLLAATDLHALLQALTGAARPRYHHHALLRDADGRKLAKSRGSEALSDLRAAGAAPEDIRQRLGFP